MRGDGPTAREMRARKPAADGEQTSLAYEAGCKPGSWGNPRIRRDGVATRTTTVHLPLDLASKLDEVRLRTHRRLSDILTEAAREWLARRPSGGGR